MKNINELVDEVSTKNKEIERNYSEFVFDYDEIIDRNIEFATIISKYKKDYGFNDRALLIDLVNREPAFFEGFNQIRRLDVLEHADNNPVFRIPEVRKLYETLKESQNNASFMIHDDESIDSIKVNTLKKAFSIGFEISNMKQFNLSSVYGDFNEYMILSDSINLLEACGDTQFIKPLRDMCRYIKRNSSFAKMKDENYQRYSSVAQI